MSFRNSRSTIGNAASAARPSSGNRICRSKITPMSGLSPREDRVQPRADRSIDQRAGNDPEKRGHHEPRQGTPTKAGTRLATKNGTAGTSRISNSIGTWLRSIPAFKRLDPARPRPSARQDGRQGPSVRPGRRCRAQRGGDDVVKRSGKGGEQEAPGQRRHGRAGQREGDDGDIGADEAQHGRQVMGVAKGQQRRAVRRNISKRQRSRNQSAPPSATTAIAASGSSRSGRAVAGTASSGRSPLVAPHADAPPRQRFHTAACRQRFHVRAGPATAEPGSARNRRKCCGTVQAGN